LALAISKLLPGFRARGRLIIKEPLDHLLRGICLDASSTKGSFYPTAFVQPLYMPKAYIFFSFGGRLRTSNGQYGWKLTAGNANNILEDVTRAIQAQALPLIDKIRTPLDLAIACDSPEAFSDRFKWRPDDINILEAAAYSWLLAGDEHMALRKFSAIRDEVRTGTDNRDWVLDLDARAGRFAARLEAGERQLALAELEKWRCQAVRELRLEPNDRRSGHVESDRTIN
jgi:hypothetical protein